MFFEIQNGKNASLAIVDFVKLATPLPGDTDRLVSLLGGAGFVDKQTAIVFTTNEAIGITGDLINNPLVIPWRVGQKMLKDLIIRTWNSFSYTLHVFFIRLNQAFEILFRDTADIACTQLK